MYILIVMLLSNGVYTPIDSVEFSSSQTCDNAKNFLKNNQQLKFKNVFAECFQR